MNLALKKYIRISFFNLLLVALMGLIMRYKILYSLPFIDQKNLLHGHSHFAFAGWITQTLMVLMVSYLSKQTGKNEFIVYKKVLIANLVAAYGMLITFPIQGYGLFSIVFSTFSVFVSYYFAFRFWKDLNKLSSSKVVHYWFKAALFFSVLSSVGTFGLAYMMANKIIYQNWYLAAVYFYLHFQYNGWFFFVCMGLFCEKLMETKEIPENKLKILFWLFTLTCVPTYFLSALWLPIPVWVYVLVVIASFIQVIAWCWLLQITICNSHQIFSLGTPYSKRIFKLCAFALTIKLLLQLGSTIPSLSIFAFGFRPIVIAYLHLVLLGVISIFIVGYMFFNPVVYINKTIKTGTVIFIGGIILNEIILMLQGITAMDYIVVPFTNELLLFISLLMFSGILLMFISQVKGTK